MSRDCGSFTDMLSSVAFFSPPRNTNAFFFTLIARWPHGKSSVASGYDIA